MSWEVEITATKLCCCSVYVMSDSLWPHGLQYARIPCPSLSPGVFPQAHVHWILHAIQPSHPLPSPSPPAFNLSKHQGLFWWVGSHQVARVLELQLQHQSFQCIFRVYFLWDWLVWSPCYPRDSQESPAAQFKSISSLAVNLLDGTTLTSIHEYWKTHSFDYMDFCWQSDSSAF